MSQIYNVTTVLSIKISFLLKSAPMVGFDCPVVFPLRYCWRSVVLPTPESPKITILRKFFFFYILKIKLILFLII